MSEHDLFESVELARERLSALRDLRGMLEKLEAHFALLREILDRTSDAVFAKDRDGRYAMINPRGADLFGKTMAEVLGADDRALFEPADARHRMAVDREVMKTGEARTSESTREVRGARITLLTTTTAWYDKEGQVRGVIGVGQDVTQQRSRERKDATHRDRMRSMAAEIVLAEERLRRTLAAELQSGLGQDIALAKLRLSMLRTSADAELHGPLSGIEDLVERANQSLRAITYQISPSPLHDLGLVAALQWLAEDIDEKYKIQVRVTDDDSPRIEDEGTRVLLFRAVRELLVNAATHSHAREVDVAITRSDAMLCVTVTDAGAGFDAADLDRHGNGLVGIREQLQYVNGTMRIASSPGRGTTVTLTAPTSSAVPAANP